MRRRRRFARTLELVDDWEREFEYTSFDKKTIITASASDVFTQMALHEVHHRAQVMAMLRELGAAGGPLVNLDFGYLMMKQRPVADR